MVNYIPLNWKKSYLACSWSNLKIQKRDVKHFLLPIMRKWLKLTNSTFMCHFFGCGVISPGVVAAAFDRILKRAPLALMTGDAVILSGRPEKIHLAWADGAVPLFIFWTYFQISRSLITIILQNKDDHTPYDIHYDICRNQRPGP